MSKFSQKGVSLYLAIMIMVILLAIVLGMTTILFGQIKAIRTIGYSVIALHAADTGIERELKIIFKDNNPPESNYSSLPLANGSSYTVKSVCCKYEDNPLTCSWTETNPCPLPDEDKYCLGSYYCIRSTGAFKGIKRAIEVGI